MQAKKEDKERLYLAADDALDRVRHAGRMLTKRTLKASIEKRKILENLNIVKCARRCFDIEMDMLHIIADEASNAPQMGEDVCQALLKLVEEIDQPAQDVKSAWPTYISKLGRAEYGLEERANYRPMIVKHNAVLHYLKKTAKEIRNLLEDNITELEEALALAANICDIFVCYAHKDNETQGEKDILIEAIDELVKSLGWRLWYDDNINTAENWHYQIQKRVEQVDVGIALISDAFFESKYIKNEEIKKLLRKRMIEGTRIFPIILKKTQRDLKSVSWLYKTQCFPASTSKGLRDVYSNDKDLVNAYRSTFFGHLQTHLEKLEDPKKAREIITEFQL